MAEYPDYMVTLSLDKENPNHLTVAFFVGRAALNKGYKVAVVLLLDAVRVDQKGYVDDIDIGHPFEPTIKIMRDYLDGGGELKVCGA